MNNDRFRFRIWNKVLRRYQKSIILTRDDEVCAPGSGDDRFVIEQCTGMKDKHSNLIFEGDKVKTVTGAVGVVVWHGYYAGFKVKLDNTDGEDSCFVDESQEVIGNIHENDEGK